MENDTSNICHACGQRIGYRSAVSRGTVVTLQKIRDFVEDKGVNAVHIEKEMVQAGKLTGTQMGNAKGHMVRLGLLAHVGEPGNYCLTDMAMKFLAGAPIRKEVTVKKRTEDKGSHTVEGSVETCVIGDFRKKGDYWEVPGFEIRSGSVIRHAPRGKGMQAGIKPRQIAVRWNGAVTLVPEDMVDRFVSARQGAMIV